MALAMLSVTPMLLLPRDHVATAALKEYATRFIIPQAVLATLAIPIMVSLVNWSLAARANVDGRALARFVGETTIFPLILGFFTSFLFPNLRRWFPFLVMMGALSLLAGMLSLLPLARGAFVVLVASGTLWAVLGFTIAGLIAGQFINRSSKEHRGSFQTSLTGHPGLALAIAALNFPSESKLVCGAILFYVAVEAILTIIDVFRRRTVFRHPSDERAASVAAS